MTKECAYLTEQLKLIVYLRVLVLVNIYLNNSEEEEKKMERKGEKKNKLISLITFYSFVASFRVGGL